MRISKLKPVVSGLLKYFTRCLLLMTTCALMACATSGVSSFESAEATDQLFEDEERLWDISEEASEGFRMAGLIYDDPDLNAYLQEITDSLFPDFIGKIKVRAFKSSNLNAFVMPNGNVFVNIGLLARMENEAQLASVLAHEGIHFTQRHSLESNRSAKSTMGFGVLLNMATGLPIGSLLAASSISGFSRSKEDESDTMGFERLLKAGYKVEEGTEFFAQVARENKATESKRAFFFASHPKMEARAKNFAKLSAERNNPNGKLATERFRQMTERAALDALQEELSNGNEKLLRFLLEQEDHLQHLPLGSRFFLAEAYRIRAEENDAERAIQEYQQTITEAPNYAPSYSALGLMQMKANEVDLAIENFTTYLNLAPNAKNAGYVKQYLEQLKGQ